MKEIGVILGEEPRPFTTKSNPGFFRNLIRLGIGRVDRSAKPLHPITPKPGVLGAPALRHPKSSATLTFSAACEAVPNPKPEHNLETVKPVRP